MFVEAAAMLAAATILEFFRLHVQHHFYVIMVQNLNRNFVSVITSMHMFINVYDLLFVRNRSPCLQGTHFLLVVIVVFSFSHHLSYYSS